MRFFDEGPFQSPHSHHLLRRKKHTPGTGPVRPSKGFTALGFSGHALTSFDLSCCMTLEKYPEYLRQLRRLRQQYWGQLDILIGMEQDSAQLIKAEDFGLPAGTPKEEWPIQYRIASVHCIPPPQGGLPYVIDSTQEDVARAATRPSAETVWPWQKPFSKRPSAMPGKAGGYSGTF